MNKSLLILLFLAFAACAQQYRVAVMPTLDDVDSLSLTDLDFLTGRLRAIAGSALPKDKYGIMTQESIVARMGSMERAEQECREATCLADLGKRVQAHYVSQGRIGRFSGSLTLRVEVYNSETGNLIGSLTETAGSLRDIAGILDKSAADMFRTILEKEPALVLAPPAPIAISDSVLASAPAPVVRLDAEQKGNNKVVWAVLSNAVGLALIGAGYLQDREMLNRHEDYRSLGAVYSQGERDKAWQKAEDAKSARNGLYIAGGLLFAVGVVLWF